MPQRDRSVYAGSYSRRARALRDMANSDPGTRCWRCGRTLAEEQARVPDRRVTWDAGHVVAGDPLSPLAAEHSTCNRSAGAVASNQAQGLNPSRRWF